MGHFKWETGPTNFSENVETELELNAKLHRRFLTENVLRFACLLRLGQNTGVDRYTFDGGTKIETHLCAILI